MIDTWNQAKLNEKISGRDSWNPAILNEAVTDRDSWNPAILNESAGETPVVFEATITASFPEGATCTATDGTTTLTADDNPMAFSIPNEGTWAVACVANGVTFSENVVITTNGQTETVDLTPVGDTYATTDSVPVLIACAGIGDSEITTIAGALADVETLTAILESENAVDYLVRSTTFASDVTADSVAMTGIGAINYDADTLLADSTWLAAICNSTYFESVLNVKVPTMTSDTTPSGQVIYTSTSGSDYPWRAFDGNWTSTSGKYCTGATPGYIGYVFTANTKVYKTLLKPHGDYQHASYQIQGSTDGVTWDNCSSDTPCTPNAENTIINTATVEGRYWRAYGAANANVMGYMVEIQFYGRVDV
jgi:hypothetical protein